VGPTHVSRLCTSCAQPVNFLKKLYPFVGVCKGLRTKFLLLTGKKDKKKLKKKLKRKKEKKKKKRCY